MQSSSETIQALRARMSSMKKPIQQGTPKRKRTESPAPKIIRPQPKIGTKVVVGGLAVVPQSSQSSGAEKSKFDKAVWISRLSPAVTSDEIAAYVTSNTSITDEKRINVHKLVKKDQDLSQLKFVSFKIELNGADFDILIEPDVWPANVLVREFTPSPKPITFGAFLPTNLNGLSQMRSKTPDTMDATEMRQ